MKGTLIYVLLYTFLWCAVPEASRYLFASGLLVKHCWYLLIIEFMWLCLGGYTVFLAFKYLKLKQKIKRYRRTC